MNKDSCDMVRVNSEEAVTDGPCGAFFIETLASGQVIMWHKLPDGNAGLLRLRPIVAGDDVHPSWEWNGDRDKPTLRPSVHLPRRWHGWFTAGRMVSC
jgi:hypothetical protein